MKRINYLIVGAVVVWGTPSAVQAQTGWHGDGASDALFFPRDNRTGSDNGHDGITGSHPNDTALLDGLATSGSSDLNGGSTAMTSPTGSFRGLGDLPGGDFESGANAVAADG